MLGNLELIVDRCSGQEREVVEEGGGIYEGIAGSAKDGGYEVVVGV
jgi:hypothetical protein